MHTPQWIMLTLLIIGMAANIYGTVTDMRFRYTWGTTLHPLVIFALLWWGGFWG